MHPFPFLIYCPGQLLYLKYNQMLPNLYRKVINFSRKYIYVITAHKGRTGMENYYGIAAIAGICVVVLLMGTMKQKAGWISVFILRSILGIVGICVTNSLLESLGISVAAGINPVNVLTIGTLGIGGFGLVYGILFYRFL